MSRTVDPLSSPVCYLGILPHDLPAQLLPFPFQLHDEIREVRPSQVVIDIRWPRKDLRMHISGPDQSFVRVQSRVHISDVHIDPPAHLMILSHERAASSGVKRRWTESRKTLSNDEARAEADK